MRTCIFSSAWILSYHYNPTLLDVSLAIVILGISIILVVLDLASVANRSPLQF